MIDVLIAPPRSRTAIKVNSGSKGNGDRPFKSLLKTISWRLVGTIDTITISYIVTGQISSALSIGSIEVVSKMILYYFHERLWSKSIKFEKVHNNQPDNDEIIRGIRPN